MVVAVAAALVAVAAEAAYDCTILDAAAEADVVEWVVADGRPVVKVVGHTDPVGLVVVVLLEEADGRLEGTEAGRIAPVNLAVVVGLVYTVNMAS